MALRLSTVLALALLLSAGCGTGRPSPSGPSSSAPGPPSPSRGASPTASSSPGWTVTVYYTAVQRFHSGEPVTVTGCPRLECRHGHDDLGRYPVDFVRAVRDEGTGLTSTGRYLNWSSDTGYWLDSVARDGHGGVLRPFGSAAADGDVLAAGTPFRILDCGDQPVSGPVCDRLRSAHWTITDEFTPGLGGARHVDVYIGAETGPGFTDSDWYTTLNRATLSVPLGR